MKGASPLIKRQLIAFGTAGALATVVLAMTFLRVPEALGINRYEVRVEFAQGAGLYEGAEVTYLGHPVGRVDAMETGGDRVVVTLKLVDDVDVPADVTAEIHSRSAVGEQYVELVPSSNAAPTALADGDLIELDRTSYPVEIGPVLDNVHALVSSLDEDNLDLVLDETSAALDGGAGDLQTILDQGSSLIAKADENFEPTAQLIRDTEPFLASINGQEDGIVRLTGNLDQLTAELRAGDEDLEALLARGPQFTDTTSALLDDLGRRLPALLANSNRISTTLATYDDHLAQLLSDYPLALSIVQSTTLPILGDNAIRLTLGNVADPPECTEGFLPPSQWASPFDPSPRRSPLVYCKAPNDDPRAVRGARNVPCVDNPARREGEAANC